MERHPELEPTTLLEQTLGCLTAVGILLAVLVLMGVFGLAFGDCPRCD